jgi:hypothetical protein
MRPAGGSGLSIALMPATYSVQYRRGVLLPDLGLWLDARERHPLAVVSHAHGDHIARHDTVVCTEATYRILSHRTQRRRAPRKRAVPDRTVPRLLGYGEEMEHRDGVVSLHAAGHVLGSSQVLVRHRGLRILYSGDIKLRAGRTAEPLEPVCADVLVVESTFGRPQYRFPPVQSVVAAICDFCVDSLARDATPVLLGYSLGKGQELLACLAGAGLPIYLHPALHAVTEIYRSLGVELPPAECFAGSVGDGGVLIWPPHLRASPAFAALGKTRTAYVSGWAVDRDAALHAGCDSAFPLSDHADFDDLCTYVEESGASCIYTLFGFAEDFAHQLRRRGRRAQALASEYQLALELQ